MNVNKNILAIIYEKIDNFYDKFHFYNIVYPGSQLEKLCVVRGLINYNRHPCEICGERDDIIITKFNEPIFLFAENQDNAIYNLFNNSEIFMNNLFISGAVINFIYNPEKENTWGIKNRNDIEEKYTKNEICEILRNYVLGCPVFCGIPNLNCGGDYLYVCYGFIQDTFKCCSKTKSNTLTTFEQPLKIMADDINKALILLLIQDEDFSFTLLKHEYYKGYFSRDEEGCEIYEIETVKDIVEYYEPEEVCEKLKKFTFIERIF